MSTKSDQRTEPRYQCRECGDEHHPDDRDEHEITIGVTCCPACGATRARVVQDYDGRVYDDEW